MESLSTQKDKHAVVFTVEVAEELSDKEKWPAFVLPKRFLQYKKKLPTIEDLERKQENAKERRKKLEETMISRIKERREECLKIDAKVQLLLQQDAKRQGLKGTEVIQPMSRKEATRVIQSVAKDVSRISRNNINITEDTGSLT